MPRIPRFLFWTALLITQGLYAVAQPAPAPVPMLERTPAYFVDRYGSATSSKNVSEHAFIHPTQGAVRVRGQFAVREFRKDGLQVQVVFFLPSLKLAEARLQLPRRWTNEQIDAALGAYAGDWKAAGSNIAVKTWITPSGARAISMLNSLHLQTPGVVGAVDEVLREADAKRKAVPRF